MSENRIIAGIGVFFGVGIVLHLIPSLSFIPDKITDLFLFAANLIVFLHVLGINRKGAFLLLFFSFWIFTFLAEAAGVHTGTIFGTYQYGNTLKLKLLEVPLIIPFNWVMLVLGMTSLIQSARLPSWLVPGISAFGLVLFDYIMEPVAVRFDYWTWKEDLIPLQNYLAWFLIAMLLSAVAVLAGIKLDKKILRYYVVIQGVFFLVLNLFYRWVDA